MDIRKQGIIRSERGILEKDGIHFHNSSAFSQQHLFHAFWGAQYVCTAPYRVDRTGFNAFHLFFIKEGHLNFSYRGVDFTARENSVVLLNNNFPAHHYADDRVRFYWFHFHGAASEAYCAHLWNHSGAHFPNFSALEKDFISIMNMLPMDAHADDRISVTIHHILSALNISGHAALLQSPQTLQAKEFMEEHFRENLSIADIAASVGLSPYYFSHRFKAETDSTPHNFLLLVRLNYAKKQLSSSSDSIEEIAYECCFSSPSNFIRAFKKYTGLTPHKFRAQLITD